MKNKTNKKQDRTYAIVMEELGKDPDNKDLKKELTIIVNTQMKDIAKGLNDNETNNDDKQHYYQ